MLRVTIELVPHGKESAAMIIEQCTIVNDGTHPERPHKGNYTATFKGRRHGNPTEVRIEDFPRLSLGAWYLLHRALDQIAVDDGKVA